MGARKSGFDSDQGFPYYSSFQTMFKVLYVNSFYIIIIIMITVS